MFSKLLQTNEKSQSLNEATYYGPNVLLTKAEKIISQMRESFAVMDADKFWFQYTRQLEQIFCELFGFEKFYIEFIPVGVAFTFPASISYHTLLPFNDKYVAMKGKYGPTFKPRTNMRSTMCLSYDIFDRFTDREILAIMLHEIGHSFDITMVRRILLINPIMMAVGVIYSISYVFKDILRISKLDQLFGKIFGPLFIAWGYISGKITTILYDLAELVPGYGLENILIRVYNLNVLNILGYDGEVFSDAFATSYGYGPELSSALSKMENKTISAEFAKEHPLLGIGKLSTEIAKNLIVEIIQPHPRTKDRITLNLRYLKDAAKKTKNPGLKKDLEEEIKQLEKVKIDDINNNIMGQLFGPDPDPEKVQDWRNKTITTLKGKYPNIDFEN